MTVIASCHHTLMPGEETVSVRYADEVCDAVDGFKPCVVYAEFCPKCAADWQARGWLLTAEQAATFHHHANHGDDMTNLVQRLREFRFVDGGESEEAAAEALLGEAASEIERLERKAALGWQPDVTGVATISANPGRPTGRRRRKPRDDTRPAQT
jgi:hypothetical protein